MSHSAAETPFDNPTITNGYPLDKAERRELDKAIRDLEPSIDGSDSASPAVALLLFGIAATTAGAALLSVPAGLIVLGVLLLALGVAYARGLES